MLLLTPHLNVEIFSYKPLNVRFRYVFIKKAKMLNNIHLLNFFSLWVALPKTGEWMDSHPPCHQVELVFLYVR